VIGCHRAVIVTDVDVGNKKPFGNRDETVRVIRIMADYGEHAA
jgi:hypothetical protein